MLHITRDSAYADKIRNYKVEIDGAVIDTIADGASKDLGVSPGTHTLRLTIDWCSSNTVNFSLTKNETVNFRCSSNLKGSKVWLGIFYIVFLPHKYIKLEQLS